MVDLIIVFEIWKIYFLYACFCYYDAVIMIVPYMETVLKKKKKKKIINQNFFDSLYF